MSIYRKIYKEYYGSIPVDEYGRTFDIHHIDGNHNNDDIFNLVAISIQEHYDIHYKQGDWGAALAVLLRMDKTSEEISYAASQLTKKRILDGSHHFLGPNVNKKRLENGTHNFLNSVFQKKVQYERIKNGTHPLLGPNNNLKNLKEGKHPSQILITCIYCNKTMGKGQHNRWHGENCKNNLTNI